MLAPVLATGRVDLVIGKGHKGGFATLAERKSRLYLALPIANKTAQAANDAIAKLLMPLKQGQGNVWGGKPHLRSLRS